MRTVISARQSADQNSTIGKSCAPKAPSRQSRYQGRGETREGWHEPRPVAVAVPGPPKACLSKTKTTAAQAATTPGPIHRIHGSAPGGRSGARGGRKLGAQQAAARDTTTQAATGTIAIDHTRRPCSRLKCDGWRSARISFRAPRSMEPNCVSQSAEACHVCRLGVAAQRLKRQHDRESEQCRPLAQPDPTVSRKQAQRRPSLDQRR